MSRQPESAKGGGGRYNTDYGPGPELQVPPAQWCGTGATARRPRHRVKHSLIQGTTAGDARSTVTEQSAPGNERLPLSPRRHCASGVASVAAESPDAAAGPRFLVTPGPQAGTARGPAHGPAAGSRAVGHCQDSSRNYWPVMGRQSGTGITLTTGPELPGRAACPAVPTRKKYCPQAPAQGPKLSKQ